jgi:hypothetical protein
MMPDEIQDGDNNRLDNLPNSTDTQNMYVTPEYANLLAIERRLMRQIEQESDSETLAKLCTAAVRTISVKVATRKAQREIATTRGMKRIEAERIIEVTDEPAAGAEPKQIAQSTTTPEKPATVPTTPPPDQSQEIGV